MSKIINKHGYIMHGLKAAAGATRYLTGDYGDLHVQISYDTVTGDVLTHECTSNSWVRYCDPVIVTCGFVTRRTTMQQIADMVATYLASHHRAAEI